MVIELFLDVKHQKHKAYIEKHKANIKKSLSELPIFLGENNYDFIKPQKQLLRKIILVLENVYSVIFINKE